MSKKSVVCAIALFAAACAKGGSNQEQAAPPPAPSEPAAAEPHPVEPPTAPTQVPAPAPTAAQAPSTNSPADTPAAPAASDKPTLDVRIKTSGVTMKFDVTRIKAAPGQAVHLVLENQLPGQLPHNWVLVKPGTEAAVAAAGLKEGPTKGYYASSPDILAHTEMVAPGKSNEVTFTAPAEPGSYPYICTFPGHYMMMKGILEVTVTGG